MNEITLYNVTTLEEPSLGDASSTANKIAAGAATVATVALYVPAPAGPIIAAAAGIIAGAAALVGKIFNHDKANALNAEREGWESSTAKIRSENTQLDNQISMVKAKLSQINTALQQQGLAGFGSAYTESQGLGFCLIGCKKKKAETNLANAKDEYERVLNEQNQKSSVLKSLISEYYTIVERLYNAIQKKTVNNTILYVGGATLLVVGFLLFVKKN